MTADDASARRVSLRSTSLASSRVGFEQQVAHAQSRNHHDGHDAQDQRHLLRGIPNTRGSSRIDVCPHSISDAYTDSAQIAPRPIRNAAPNPRRSAWLMTVRLTGPTGTDNDKPADKSCEKRLKEIFHRAVASPPPYRRSSSSSDSISRRQRLLTHGRTKPYSRYATNNAASVTSKLRCQQQSHHRRRRKRRNRPRGVQSMYLKVGIAHVADHQDRKQHHQPGSANRQLPSVRSCPTIHIMNIVTLTTSAAADGIGNPTNSRPL